MNNQDYLESYLKIAKELAYSGNNYDKIKEKIQIQPISEEELKQVLRQADQFIVEYQIAKQEKSKVLNMLLIGIGIFLLGVSITLFTFFSQSSQYVLAYGAILGGAWLAVKSFINYQKPIEDFIPKYRRFSKRF